ncbi:MAG: hypothetical protein U0Q18_16575 [Bryobacteraceae bacterium]
MRNSLICGFLIFTSVAMAQQTVAPTPEQAGSPRGENTGDYNVVNSFETGYRFAVVDGSSGKYRSDVNYGNGIRLLNSNLTINSKDGHGKWFDEIVLTTIGLGNDPYESATLRVQKNKLFRYDMLWRLDDYYNPGLVLTAGQHFMDTSRRMQDHDLTLFPQSKIRLHLGYSRNLQDGPALSTVQLFNAAGSEFPLFMNVRREQNEYRLGADVELAGFRFTATHTWNYFKDDSGIQENGLGTGNNPGAGVTLSQFQRSEPYHGASPAWLGNLYKGTKFWAVDGRISYVSGRRNFIMDENAFGTTAVGQQNQQIVVGGDASRPSLAGDLNISLYPGSRLTIVTNTSVHSIRMDGDSAFAQFNDLTQLANIIYFRYLGIRTIANATDLHFRVQNWLSFYAGYHYSTRRIRDIESFGVPGTGSSTASYEQENHLHSGLFGIRLKPVKPLTINLETETGRADHPFTPVSDRNYQALGGRVEYRVRNLTLSTAYKQNYNGNSVTLSSYSSRARNYSAAGSWSPRPWLGLDASYTKLHLDTVSGIAFFAGVPDLTHFTGLDEVYISNIHAANFGARFTVKKRVDVYLGYSITRDTGDGRAATVLSGTTGPVASILGPVETFPLNYQAPLGRVSVRLNPKLRWNAGWQFYNYHEDFGLYSFYQGYHANTGYTSLSWSF